MILYKGTTFTFYINEIFVALSEKLKILHPCSKTPGNQIKDANYKSKNSINSDWPIYLSFQDLIQNSRNILSSSRNLCLLLRMS